MQWGSGLSAASMAEPAASRDWELGSQEARSSLPQFTDRSTLEQQGGKEVRRHWSHMESQTQIVCSYSFFPAPLDFQGVYTELSHFRGRLLSRHGCDHRWDSSRS